MNEKQNADKGELMGVTTGEIKSVTTPRKRAATLNLRVTPQEKEDIERCAAALGMTQTELVLNGVGIIKGMIEKHRENQERRESWRD
ncbi:MAG: DUF1778 domain-containing protein [Lachnospiraceae bacterium]|nr:DUF1778 domain-containing protein [Lachnospiraceae bacterium]MCM1240463.1 DUF1778 domain-containing protein [Lachnospiraceae bacterium]